MNETYSTESEIGPFRPWAHKPGDLYHVIRNQIVGNPQGGYENQYTLMAGPFQKRSTAWRHGIADMGHDDFNLGVTRNGILAAMLWESEIVDDGPEVLREVAKQTGLNFGNVTESVTLEECESCARGSMHYPSRCGAPCVEGNHDIAATYQNYGYWRGQCSKCNRVWEVDSSG